MIPGKIFTALIVLYSSPPPGKRKSPFEGGLRGMIFTATACYENPPLNFAYAFKT
jgi:hypothetical protein